MTDVEIFDVSGETRDTMTPEEASQLSADGAVVVYSIVDRASFEYARHVLALLGAVPGLRITLLANKADLAHLRAVQASEGRALAEAAAGAPFYEVSVAEDSADLYQAFELLVGECHALLATNNNNNNNSTNANYNNNSGSNNNANGADRQAQQQGGTAGRTRKFSVTKMLGTLIGSKSSSPPPAAPAPTASLQGTVVVCHKSELFRRDQ
ncbi:hypothetical protein FOCC_FOCC015580 [Frankliniella occidentalis]|nr:hypothetical protein FOCC_FOCC015580 [Frankliniella occidentalis]